MKSKGILKITAGIFITVFAVYFAARALGGLNPGILLKAEINWKFVCFSGGLFILSTFFRSLAYPLGIDRRMGLLTALRITFIGNAANMILPLHAGEGLRFTFFPSRYGTARRSELLTVTGASDVAVILILSLLAIPLAGFKNRLLVKGLTIFTILFCLACFAGIFLVMRLPRLRKAAKRFIRHGFFQMSFWIVLSWMTALASIWAGLIAYGYDSMESIPMALAVFAVTNIVMFIPSSPGGIGIFEYGVVLGLKEVGIPEFPAKEVGMLIHIIQYAALLPTGAIFYIASFPRKKQNGKARKNS